MFMYLKDSIEAKREQLTQNNETIDENNMGLAHRLHNIMILALPLLPHQHLMFLNKMRR